MSTMSGERIHRVPVEFQIEFSTTQTLEVIRIESAYKESRYVFLNTEGEQVEMYEKEFRERIGRQANYVTLNKLPFEPLESV